jgi:hypothetical protein
MTSRKNLGKTMVSLTFFRSLTISEHSNMQSGVSSVSL